MKNVIILFATVLMILTSAQVAAQSNISIDTKGDKIYVEIENDGETFIKTYHDFEEMKSDETLKDFSKKAIGLEGCKVSEEDFEIDFENGFYFKSNGLYINVDNKKSKSKKGNATISIDFDID